MQYKPDYYLYSLQFKQNKIMCIKRFSLNLLFVHIKIIFFLFNCHILQQIKQAIIDGILSEKLVVYHPATIQLKIKVS